MFNIRKIALAGGAALGLVVCGPAWADATITATLLDKGANMEMPKDLGFNTGGDMTKATMGISLSQATIAAGHITFHVVNSSKDMVHEMIVARLKSLDEKLPYLADEEEVDEDHAGDLGEVSELEPGASGELGIDLTEGSYILYCNVPGHYMAGMWTILTVTK